jgi:hypothetical protein
MIDFLIGFFVGITFTALALFAFAVYSYTKIAEQAHKDGYENPYL